MRIRTALIASLLSATAATAQPGTAEKIFAFKISSYIEKPNDSIAIVQVVQQDAWPVLIKEKQLGVLQHCYQPGGTKDTTRIGWGRCQLIKGDYYYFGLHLTRGQQPAGGDLLYTKVNVPLVHDGLLVELVRHAITFTDVTEKEFMFSSDIFTQTAAQETAVLDSMVADIHYTGKAMLEQMPDQNQLVKGGLFNGQRLFDAMQKTTRQELSSFFKYVAARPQLYAGNTWKISEVFATWMVNATPRVVEQGE